LASSIICAEDYAIKGSIRSLLYVISWPHPARSYTHGTKAFPRNYSGSKGLHRHDEAEIGT
jgi:hypothetical protein